MNNEFEVIILFGCGKTAEVYAGLIEAEGLFEVAGFTVDREYMPGSRFLGRPVVPFDAVETHFPPESYGMAIAAGYHDANRLREARFAAARAKGYTLPPIVSRRAWLPADAAPGPGAFIMDRVSVQPGACVAENAALWSGVVVGHHAHIGPHAWLAANATIGSSTTVGARCLLGLGATVGHEMAVGEGAFLGAGTVLTKSTGANAVHIARDTERFRLDHDDFLRMTRMR